MPENKLRKGLFWILVVGINLTSLRVGDCREMGLNSYSYKDNGGGNSGGDLGVGVPNPKPNSGYGYAKVRSFPSDGILYTDSLVGPATHSPVSSLIQRSTLKIKGEVYNISEALGREAPYDYNYDPHGKNSQDSISNRDSYSHGAGDLTPVDPGADDNDTPPDPIQGAVDYVLLPLIFMAIAGPIFVVMYIVVSSIESKLPPNVQLKRKRRLRSVTNLHKHSYFNVNAMVDGAKGVFYDAMERPGCPEKAACELGQIVQSFRKTSETFYQYLESFLKLLVPRKFNKPLQVYMASARSQVKDCGGFACNF